MIGNFELVKSLNIFCTFLPSLCNFRTFLATPSISASMYRSTLLMRPVTTPDLMNTNSDEYIDEISE